MKLTVAACAALIALACSGCGDDEREDMAERVLGDGYYQDAFPELLRASEVDCEQDGELRGRPVFACEWRFASDGDRREGRWTIRSGYSGLPELARVSEGGDAGAPPRDAGEAAERVSIVMETRNGGRAECQLLSGEAYSCALFAADGTELAAGSTGTARLRWVWNDDGTVKLERYEPPSYETLSVLRASADTPATGTNPRPAPSPQGSPGEPDGPRLFEGLPVQGEVKRDLERRLGRGRPAERGCAYHVPALGGTVVVAFMESGYDAEVGCRASENAEVAAVR
jgi:hypothetical protein